MTWLAANWAWIVVLLLYLGCCAFGLAFVVGAFRGENSYTPDELRRVRDFARDDTEG